MALTLHLPPHTERKLEELAAHSGQDPADYAVAVIERHLQFDPGAATPEDGGDRLAAAIAHMTARSPEQLSEARARAKQFIRPGKPLPQGQTIFDAVGDRWPGDESDEQIAEALRNLS